jgi:hypothetical protein
LHDFFFGLTMYLLLASCNIKTEYTNHGLEDKESTHVEYHKLISSVSLSLSHLFHYHRPEQLHIYYPFIQH